MRSLETETEVDYGNVQDSKILFGRKWYARRLRFETGKAVEAIMPPSMRKQAIDHKIALKKGSEIGKRREQAVGLLQ